MKAIMACVGGRASAWAKIRARLAQDLIGLAKLPVLPLESLSLAAMSLVRPGFPLSRSAFFTHSFSVCGVQPILPAIETTVAHRDGCSGS